MAYKDLRAFIKLLEKKKQIVRIKDKVSSELEITEFSDRAVKNKGPALFFENVENSEFPVVTNLFGTMERMCLALETESLDAIAERITELLEPKPPLKFIDKIKMLPKLMELSKIFPKIVKNAPCKDVILKGDDIDLFKIPILKTWPLDGGKFITLPLIFTKDPETGIRNVGMYRIQIYDKSTTGMHWHPHKHGSKHLKKAKERNQKLEVAVAIGSCPAVIYSATAPLPDDVDEMIFAGFIRKQPVELVKCETVELEVPANSEFVIEGYVDPNELKMEGPFGDHTGYYSLADMYPVFHVTCITHRKDAIYPATIVGKPPMEDAYLGKATERIFLSLLKKTLPEIVDINLPVEGGFHNFAFVSINKQYPAHAEKIMHALWGLGQMMFTKVIVIFDSNVNVQDMKEVLWRLGNNIDPKRDTYFVNGPVDALEHASSLPFVGSKMGIDATRKWKEEGFNREWPPDVEMREEIKKLVDKKWKKIFKK
jgi:4-hydroxy-3-polyprenylbenzoate decarboxylase